MTFEHATSLFTVLTVFNLAWAVRRIARMERPPLSSQDKGDLIGAAMVGAVGLALALFGARTWEAGVFAGCAFGIGFRPVIEWLVPRGGKS